MLISSWNHLESGVGWWLLQMFATRLPHDHCCPGCGWIWRLWTDRRGTGAGWRQQIWCIRSMVSSFFFEVSTSRNSTSIILLYTEVLNYPDLMSSLFEIFLRMICFANWRLKFHGLSRVQHPSACLGQKCRRFLGLKSDHLVMKKQNLWIK